MITGNNVANQVAETQSSLDPTTVCPVHSETGKCKYGFKCRFLGAHAKATEDDFPDESSISLVIDGEKAAHTALSAVELNFVDPDVRKLLRTRKVTAFCPPRGCNSTDGLHFVIARLSSYLCIVSEAGIGQLPERNPTIIRRTRRGNPGATGGDGCRSNRDIRRRLRGFDAIGIYSRRRHVSG